METVIENPETVIETGICRFCGQVHNISFFRNLYRTKDAESDYIATRACNCPEGREFNNAEQAREDAEAEREFRLANAKEIIDELFGMSARESELDLTSEAFRNFIYEAAVMVYDGDIRTAQITSENGITAKIKFTSKDKLSITRSESFRLQQEA